MTTSRSTSGVGTPAWTESPLRLRLSQEALVSNWRWLAAKSGGAVCGAAVKANGYGLGAIAVVDHLLSAGCRDFFVATWAEAAEIARVTSDVSVSVLHGIRAEDAAIATALTARPVLNSAEQIALWQQIAPDRPCDVMVDTGINRLGISRRDIALLDNSGLTVETLMSHLASADEDSAQNAAQRDLFTQLCAEIPAARCSLANSAGIMLGADYHCNLTRPGLALYGGVPRREMARDISQVVFPQCQIIQIRTVAAGQSVGYNATWTAVQPTRVAVCNMGYADGYLRGFSNRGSARFDGHALPVVGRVSMDLTMFTIPEKCGAKVGDWLEIDYDLAATASVCGLSQYELLTGLGERFDRIWF